MDSTRLPQTADTGMKVSASASASVLRSVACGIADGITTGDDKDIKINK